MTPADALLRVDNLVMEFPAGRGRKVSAVANVSFDLHPGETLGLVGESGCGKSTTGKAVMQLPRPTRGTVRLGETDLTALKGASLRATRPRMQMIFQDPISSLNPRRTVADIVEEPLRIWRSGRPEQRREKVREVLEAVGIDVQAARERKPHEFSGGQCQRISIARAVVTEPEVIICDEPVSALDVSVQAQILNLLEDMKTRYGLTLVFIAHDLAVVKNVSDRVAVMYLGKLCEIGPHRPSMPSRRIPTPLRCSDRYRCPTPAWTPRPRIIWEATFPHPSIHLGLPVPHLLRALATDVCTQAEPQMQAVGVEHFVACHHPLVSPVEIDR
ncbi:MAG: dipeptide/oligopeptide/nickel ABC transporter ATP-binding protein [Microthrixaceae bacterium]|nr:dipeptide/oligopeptide/nickel ABC transporter ATP-binding protein [Microthrixaceae bacterium]